MESPVFEDVREARQTVQSARSLGVTASPYWCAEQMQMARRTWQS